eukprot:TRINITY_DN14821_c0_g1_i5.p2 TRINITY_DN14821_c0_g1~~TRINITY_DN14821_c0_g1_i5.p2  ORF type:complete len:115 (+),score=14.96 TRINITY_DN14821_c0_g1_i5:160-504(+)
MQASVAAKFCRQSPLLHNAQALLQYADLPDQHCEHCLLETFDACICVIVCLANLFGVHAPGQVVCLLFGEFQRCVNHLDQQTAGALFPLAVSINVLANIFCEDRISPPLNISSV